MENKEKVYASQQLICMLPPIPLKVLSYLLNWQKIDNIKFYQSQMCSYMHINASELDLAIQTLIDNKLINVCKIDEDWCFNLNKESIKKYFDVPMQVVKNHEGLKMATEVTWNKEKKTSTETSASTIDKMSNEELELLIKRLAVNLEQRKETEKVVVSVPKNKEYNYDNLPF